MESNYEGPSFTPDQLVDALATSGAVDADALRVALVGVELSTNTIEMVVEKNNLTTSTRLLAVKQLVSGLRVVDNPNATPVALLPASLARRTGALAIDGPTPVIAFVEDLPANVDQVRAELNRDDFEVWLMTATQFSKWFKELYTAEQKEARPLAVSLAEIFNAAIEMDVSDIHLSAGHPPMVRTATGLSELKFQPVTSAWLLNQFSLLLGEQKMQIHAATHNVDAGYSFGNERFRINLGQATNGMTAAIRRLPSKIPTFDDIELPAAVRTMCELERGLVLVTGPTGSGKSTTLASMLTNIALNQSRHILTLEDPIEMMIPTRRSIVHQRELGDSFKDFASGLRQSLRQDPDVVLVGEARDRETISAAVTAAETGALVFATVHSYDVSSTLGRIVATFPEGEQEQVRASLAYVLKGVVSQTLLPARTGGRVAAFEVLVSTPAVTNNLKKVDGLSQLRQIISTSSDQGMVTMEANLASLVRRGVVSQIDAEFKARDVQEFNRQLGLGR